MFNVISLNTIFSSIFFYHDQDNITIVRPYIFDGHGYHEIENVIGMRGDEFDSECDLSTGQYCIDPKLLKLMIGWGKEAAAIMMT